MSVGGSLGPAGAGGPAGGNGVTGGGSSGGNVGPGSPYGGVLPGEVPYGEWWAAQNTQTNQPAVDALNSLAGGLSKMAPSIGRVLMTLGLRIPLISGFIAKLATDKGRPLTPAEDAAIANVISEHGGGLDANGQYASKTSSEIMQSIKDGISGMSARDAFNAGLDPSTLPSLQKAVNSVNTLPDLADIPAVAGMNPGIVAPDNGTGGQEVGNNGGYSYGGSGDASQSTGPNIPPSDKKRLWEGFMNQFFGTPATDTEAAKPGLQDLMQTDWNAKQTADQALLDTLTGTTAQRTADINAAYDPYSGYLNQLIQGKPQSAPTVSIGGMNKMPFASGLYKLNSARADKANTDLYNAAANKSNLLNTLAENLAAKKADFGKTYTPNASAIDYLTNHLQPLATWSVGKQQTAQLPEESTAQKISDWLGIGKAGIDLYNSFKPLTSNVLSALSSDNGLPSDYNPGFLSSGLGLFA